MLHCSICEKNIFVHARLSVTIVILCYFSIVTDRYPMYNFLIDCPMYMERYYADEAAGKIYFDFLPGLYDAATTRNQTQQLEDWQEDMFWMTMYFSVGAWSGILMMSAPRLAFSKAPCMQHERFVQTSSIPLLPRGVQQPLRSAVPYHQIPAYQEPDHQVEGCKIM